MSNPRFPCFSELCYSTAKHCQTERKLHNRLGSLSAEITISYITISFESQEKYLTGIITDQTETCSEPEIAFIILKNRYDVIMIMILARPGVKALPLGTIEATDTVISMNTIRPEPQVSVAVLQHAMYRITYQAVFRGEGPPVLSVVAADSVRPGTEPDIPLAIIGDSDNIIVG